MRCLDNNLEIGSDKVGPKEEEQPGPAGEDGERPGKSPGKARARKALVRSSLIIVDTVYLAASCSTNGELVDTVGDMLVDLVHPNLHVVERLLVRHIVDNDDIFPVWLSTYPGILN